MVSADAGVAKEETGAAEDPKETGSPRREGKECSGGQYRTEVPMRKGI